MRNLLLPVATALVLSLCAARAEAQLLAINLRTDHAPGAEFSRARIELIDRADERRSWVTYHVAVSSADYLRGVRIAEFDNIAAGNYILAVELLDGSLRPVNGRLWYYLASGRDSVTTTLLVRP